jgi:NADH:ubiquinone oxidoreductase subunit K
VIVIAAAEVGLALAIVLRVFRTHGHIDVDRLRELADRDSEDLEESR